MSLYAAEVVWRRDGEDFIDNRFSRKHMIRFDSGLEVPCSASPQVVPPPMSDETALDPEEAFVASLASCHMLWFLGLAAKGGFRVDCYSDAATGLMEKNPKGKTAITVITLRPKTVFSGECLPSREQIEKMHHEAHERCFIANSVKAEVRCEPIFSDS